MRKDVAQLVRRTLLGGHQHGVRFLNQLDLKTLGLNSACCFFREFRGITGTLPFNMMMKIT